jgi:hypothetical protein
LRLAAGALLPAMAVGGWFGWQTYRAHVFFEPKSLFSRFPAGDSTAVSIDFAALRKSGLLSEAKATPEPEYKAFLDGTGFDYRRDLDLVDASLSPTGNYFIARGRFDWGKLRDYALKQGGSCYEQLCRMPGSTPERHISFLPLRTDTIGIAVAPDDLAVSKLTRTGAPVAANLPSAPVWLSVPGTVLRGQSTMPAGIRMMLSAFTGAERVVLTVGPSGSGLDARLETNCHTESEARLLASQLKSTASLVKDAIPRDPAFRNDDLARSLAAGTFEQQGLKVTGRWPVSKGLIDSLTAGI